MLGLVGQGTGLGFYDEQAGKPLVCFEPRSGLITKDSVN